MFSITDSIAMILCTKERAVFKLRSKAENFVLISVCDSDVRKLSGSTPCNLAQMYWFTRFLAESIMEYAPKKLLLCAGNDDDSIAVCTLLIGGYLMLKEDKSLLDLLALFEPLKWRLEHCRDLSEESSTVCEISVIDCWQALQYSMIFGWLDFIDNQVDIDNCIDMHEYLHYDSPLNGGMHVLIPSKLIAFKCPSTVNDQRLLPGSCGWVDVHCKRFFSPEFYAEILSCDYDVKLVVHCDLDSRSSLSRSSTSPWLDAADEAEGDCLPPSPDPFEESADASDPAYDPAAFESRGVAVERMITDGSLGLHAVDRFLTLARSVPGALAVHGPPDEQGLGAGGEQLVSTLLIRSYGFKPRTALAWIRLLHPSAPPRLLRFAAEDGSEAFAAACQQAAAHARRGLTKSTSFCRSAAPVSVFGGLWQGSTAFRVSAPELKSTPVSLEGLALEESTARRLQTRRTLSAE